MIKINTKALFFISAVFLNPGCQKANQSDHAPDPKVEKPTEESKEPEEPSKPINECKTSSASLRATRPVLPLLSYRNRIPTSTEKTKYPKIEVLPQSEYQKKLYIDDDELVKGWSKAYLNDKGLVEVEMINASESQMHSITIYWLPYQIYRSPIGNEIINLNGTTYSSPITERPFKVPYAFDMEETPVFAIKYGMNYPEKSRWEFFDLRK